MKDKLNEQFPPISSNGKATAHKMKRSDSPSSDMDDRVEKEPESVGNRSKIRKHTRATEKANESDSELSQILSKKLSAYVARYPLYIVGGLLTLLLTVVLFKTFYQGKNWKAKRMAEEAYYVANQYARNNGTNLQPYLSQAFRREVRQLPGLLPLSMQTATRGGTVIGVESVSLREITADSVVVEISVDYENGREEKRYQPLVYEKNQWRLGLVYSR